MGKSKIKKIIELKWLMSFSKLNYNGEFEFDFLLGQFLTKF
jgi:hypothetical protein